MCCYNPSKTSLFCCCRTSIDVFYRVVGLWWLWIGDILLLFFCCSNPNCFYFFSEPFPPLRSGCYCCQLLAAHTGLKDTNSYRLTPSRKSSNVRPDRFAFDSLWVRPSFRLFPPLSTLCCSVSIFAMVTSVEFEVRQRSYFSRVFLIFTTKTVVCANCQLLLEWNKGSVSL